jgi:nitroreductase
MTQRPDTNIDTLLASRYSVRGFKPDPVPQTTLEAIFTTAQLAPSNCNTQPWTVYVASGETRQKLQQKLIALASANAPPSPDFSYFNKFTDEHRQRQIDCAAALYGCMSIERGDKIGRQKAAMRNFEFFDAPHVAYICIPKEFCAVNVVDAGIYLQTLVLAMHSHGVASCIQAVLTYYPKPAKELLGIDDASGVIVGLAFGYEDPSVPANDTRTSRAPLDEVVTFFD